MYEISLVSTSIIILIPHFKMANIKGNYSVVIIIMYDYITLYHIHTIVYNINIYNYIYI